MLDGIAGTISIYDANDNLILELSPDDVFEVFDADGNLLVRIDELGFWIFDTSGDARARLGPLETGYSGIAFKTGNVDQTVDGAISNADFGGNPRLIVTPGEYNDQGSLDLTFVGPNDAATDRALIQVIETNLDNPGMTDRPFIDFTGAGSVSSDLRPAVIVDDIYWGTPTTVGDAPVVSGLYGRGMIAYAERETSVTLSTSAGIYVAILDTNSAPVGAGRRYRIVFSGADNMLTGGSGFTTADTWAYKLDRDVGAGFITFWGPQRLARCWVATGFRYPVPALIAYYNPQGNATVTWRLSMCKLAGAATVTSVVEANSSTPMQLGVEDVGEQV